MSSSRRLIDRIRLGEPVPFPLNAALGACTPVTRLGMWWRRRQPSVRVNAHVVSFGNLTAGGTGKTPAVIERALAEIDRGNRVAVLTRGYGSATGKAPLDSESLNGPSEFIRLGDEPALILKKVPGVVVVKNPNRVAGAHRAVVELGCNVLLLDDGFQFLRLERDENVLLIDAANPFGKGALIPRGILREPVTAMARATEIVLTRCDQAEGVEDLLNTIRTYAPGVPIRKTIHAPCGLRRVAGGEPLDLSELRGKTIAAACGIGNPESFFATLEGLGANVERFVMGPDHVPIPAEATSSDEFVVITEKDAVRTKYAAANVYALEIRLQDLSE